MPITATLINLYHLCRREMWLHAHEIRLEHTSDLVAEGRVLHQTSYRDRPGRYRELSLPGIKLDHYDPVAGVVHEVKKSSKRAAAHVAQVKYYLWILEQHGLRASHGILEYPKQRQTEEVWLSDLDRVEIPRWVAEIEGILAGDCPGRLPKSQCRACSYHDFCWSGEVEEK